MTTVRVSEVADVAALEERWRDLDARSACSFFQSWSWTGCLAAERFREPVLVEATESGRTVALALFNRVRQAMGLPRLYLGESGDDALDSPFIEQNGVLVEAGREAALTEICLRAVASSHVLVLSGIGADTLQAVRRATGQVWVRQTRHSPFVDLVRLRQTGAGYLTGRSANTRQQIRRSDRFYAAGEGLSVNRAGSVEAAHRMLDAMAELHQAGWTARGLPGSFATPFFRRFHHALVDRVFPNEQVALLEVSRGKTTAGILYNFIFRKRMSAYQSGFDYVAAQRHGKPGLTCHHAAIKEALSEDLEVYDFLAGDDRYKRSLADESERYYWVEAGPWRSSRLLRRRGQNFLRR